MPWLPVHPSHLRSRPRRPLLRAVVVVASTLCTFARAQGADEHAPPAAAPGAAAVDYGAQLDELWKTRDDPATVTATQALIKEAVAKAPTYEVLWRAARYKWWVADGMPKDEKRAVVAKAGWAYADQALKLKADGTEAHYYKAVCIGAYSQAVGVLKALTEGLESKYNDNLEVPLKADGCHDRGGPYRAKGRYYFELPWPKRDLDKSKDMLEKSIKCSPVSLRTYYYLADTLKKDGKEKEAKVAIDKVVNGDGSYDPPEARRVKEWAKPLAKEIDDDLK